DGLSNLVVEFLLAPRRLATLVVLFYNRSSRRFAEAEATEDNLRHRKGGVMPTPATDRGRHFGDVAPGAFDYGNAVACPSAKRSARGAIGRVGRRVIRRDQGEEVAHVVPRPAAGQHADGDRIGGLVVPGAGQTQDAGQVVGTVELPTLRLRFCVQQLLKVSS